MQHILLPIIFFFFVLQASAQSPLDVTYQNADEELLQLARMMDVKVLNINIRGELNGKKIALMENIVSGNTTTTNEVLTSYTTVNTDSIRISVMSRQMTKDSVKIDIVSRNLFYYMETLSVPNSNLHILMETKFDNTLTQNVPIFAYTSGIVKSFNVNGTIMEGIDYCGLRDSNTSPILWNEKYKIGNFIYYTVETR